MREELKRQSKDEHAYKGADDEEKSLKKIKKHIKVRDDFRNDEIVKTSGKFYLTEGVVSDLYKISWVSFSSGYIFF